MAQIKIDPDALREWEESRPESRKELAESIGRTTSVFSNAYARGEMNEVVLSFLRKTYGLPEDAFLPKEKTLSVHPDRLRLGVSFGEEEMVYAWAKIFGDTELDLIKSISYAAHMCYKFVEQKTLNG